MAIIPYPPALTESARVRALAEFLNPTGICTLALTAYPDGIEAAVQDRSPQAPRMRTPDLDDGTGGFGWPMVNRLARVTAVTRRAGGKTVSAFLAR